MYRGEYAQLVSDMHASFCSPLISSRQRYHREMADPFALPGKITERKVVNPEDLSSDDDDDDADVWLSKGDEKKKALQERERRKNLAMQHEGTKPSDTGHEDEVEVIEKPSSSSAGGGTSLDWARSSPKRAKRSGCDGTDLSAEYNAELEAERKRVAQQAQEMQARRKAFAALDDDEDVETSGPSDQRSTARRSHGSARGDGGTQAGDRRRAMSVPVRRIWVKLVCDGQQPIPVGCVADQPVGSGELAKRAALSIGAAASSRVVLRKCEGGPDDGEQLEPGEALDMSRTPEELGLVAQQLIWFEEKPEVLMTLRLQRSGGSRVEMRVAPTEPLDGLLRR